ncbi:unnamed protein product [Heterobilharzia americana]|nr:unnamed protein product [Heterobilharzia americana]
MISLATVFFPVFLVNLNGYRMLTTSCAFPLSLAFFAHHCSPSIRRLFINLHLRCFRSSSWSETAGISLLAPTVQMTLPKSNHVC